jgi:D-sedoheptulose 7-phosphate isomerase
MVGRFLLERRPLACFSLSVDTSILTAVGNDYDFDQVFARQVDAYLRDGDVLWALSTSGNSRNVLAAVAAARRRGGKTLGFTGGDGGKMLGACDVCFVAPGNTSYAIQQIHQLAYHVICELVEQCFQGTS